MALESTLRRLTTALRNVPGGVLVGERIRKRFGRDARTLTVRDFDGDLTMHLDLGEHMQSQIFWHGSYSRNILYLLRKALRPGMTFVDGGANVGEISLVAAKRVGPSGRVLAFEPVDAFADQLQRHRDDNRLDNIEILRMGLSDRSGEAPLYLAENAYTDGTHHDGLGTLFRSDSRSRQAATIPLATLDGMLDGAAVHLIKLDIEGAELQALHGARELLARQTPGIVIEIGRDTCRAAGYEMEDIFAFLEPFGYVFHRIGRKGALERIGAADLDRFQNVYCTRP